MEERIQRLEKLACLLEKGAITPEEFAAEKAKVLGMKSPAERPSETKFEDTETGEAHATVAVEEQRFGTASPASDAYHSQSDDDDHVRDWQENGLDWRRRAKWPALAVAIIGGVWILAKFGFVIALIAVIVAALLHRHANFNADQNSMQYAKLGYLVAAFAAFVDFGSDFILPDSGSPISSASAEQDEYVDSSSAAQTASDAPMSCNQAVRIAMVAHCGILVEEAAYRYSVGDSFGGPPSSGKLGGYRQSIRDARNANDCGPVISFAEAAALDGLSDVEAGFAQGSMGVSEAKSICSRSGEAAIRDYCTGNPYCTD